MDYKTEHDIVVKQIEKDLGTFYNILSNLDKEQHYIGNIFPDLILLDKTSNAPLFIIEVKRNGGIASCLQQWKIEKDVPAILYLIVPEQY